MVDLKLEAIMAKAMSEVARNNTGTAVGKRKIRKCTIQLAKDLKVWRAESMKEVVE